MGVLGIMRVGQYQAVKAFGDKPRLMTRKSVVALICTGPLANRTKAVNYTKETPNLLRNMLNIPSLLGGRGNQKQCYIFLVFLSKPNLKASIPIFFWCWSWGKPPREFKGKDRGFWSVVLAARWKKISFGHSVRQFLLNWSLLLWDLGKSIHIIRLVDCIACFEEEIWFCFGSGSGFLILYNGTITTLDDWFLPVLLQGLPSWNNIFPIGCGWKVFKNAIAAITVN